MLDDKGAVNLAGHGVVLIPKTKYLQTGHRRPYIYDRLFHTATKYHLSSTRANIIGSYGHVVTSIRSIKPVGGHFNSTGMRKIQ